MFERFVTAADIGTTIRSLASVWIIRRAHLTPGSDSAALRDTVLALTQLGFSQDQARKKVQAAIKAGADASSTEALLKQALAAQ